MKISLLKPVEIIFNPPGDTRVPINQTEVYPYSAIGRLTMQFPNGSWYSGTGTLIDSQHVLTAAHNLWGIDMGGKGYATAINFAPAQNGQTMPYGLIPATGAYVSEDYVTTAPPSPLLMNGDSVGDYTKYLYDFGVIKLAKKVPIGPGFVAFSDFPDQYLTTNQIHITGYPGDLAQIYGVGTMWSAQGKVTVSNDDDLLFYTISTNKGQSGAGLMIGYQNSVLICGVHVAGSTALGTNFAVRLNGTNVATIQHWQAL